MHSENRKFSQNQFPNISKKGKSQYNMMSNSGQRKSLGNIPFNNSNGQNQNYNTKDFIQNFSQKLDKHENQIEARNQIIKEMEQNIELLKREYIEEKGRGQEKEKYIQQLQSVYQQLENKYKQNNIKMEELQTKLLHYERDNQRRKSINSNSEKQYEMMKNQLNLEKQQLQETIDEIQNKLKQKESDMFKAQKVIAQLEDQMKQSTAEEDLKNAQNKIKELQNQSQQQQEKIQKLELKQKEQQKSNETKIDELNENIRKLEKQLLQAKTSNNIEQNIQQKYEEIQQELRDQVQKMLDLELKFKQIQDEKDKLNSDLKKSQVQKYELEEKHVNDIKNINNKFNTEIEKIKNKLSEAEERNKHLKQDLTMAQLDNKKFLDDAKNLRDKDTIIRKNIDVIDKNEKEIMKSLKCNHCQKIINEPVTIIPCGHNFCFGCKTAYTKQCIKCGPKVKIEAMYRNELLDDILGMVKIMQNTKDVLKQLTTNK